MSASRRKLVLGVLILLTGSVITLGLAWRTTSRGAPAASAAVPDWRPMTLVYRDEGKRQGLADHTTALVWKLSYQDGGHWRKTLLADSANPANVGTTMHFQGTTCTAYSAVTKDTFTKEYPASEGSLLPERWLSPGREQVLVAQGYATATLPDTRYVAYTKTESLPCQADPQNTLTGVVQPESCTTAPTYEADETIVYQRDTGLPVEITTRVGQEITHHIVVTEIAFP